jgi:hypothetical protein
MKSFVEQELCAFFIHNSKNIGTSNAFPELLAI